MFDTSEDTSIAREPGRQLARLGVVMRKDTVVVAHFVLDHFHHSLLRKVSWGIWDATVNSNTFLRLSTVSLSTNIYIFLHFRFFV
jgi:hypothetical protein